jgi:solute carrier family 10 (sodium/bile acid cotransporter), member 7
MPPTKSKSVLPRITSFLGTHWFFLGIVLVLVAASGLHGKSLWVQKYHVLTAGIFLAFFVTGLTLDISELNLKSLQLKAALAAMISSLLFIPLLAWTLSSFFFPAEFVIGVCIIATAPVTVVSGTVMTALGKGNIPLSVVICVLGNATGIFTMPFSLQMMVAGADTISLPVFEMLSNLVTTVLLPIVLGGLCQSRLDTYLTRFKKAFSVFQQSIVLLIIFSAFAGAGATIKSAGSILPALAAFTLFLHALILAMNYGISRLIRLDWPSTVAFTIHTSQKTLTVSYVVWAGYFATHFPLAMIPGIIYHLTQMVVDTVVAEKMKNQGLLRTRC